MSKYVPITLALAAGALITMAGPGFAAPKGGPALDANGDGKVILSEFQSGRAGRMMDHLDANKDGKLSKDEFAALRHGKDPAGKGTEGKHGDKMWARLDLNNDTFLSRSELDSFLAKRFAHMDADNDGALSPTELKSDGGKVKVGV
jgi:Ca2+-binding EF-hand superfamily protein